MASKHILFAAFTAISSVSSFPMDYSQKQETLCLKVQQDIISLHTNVSHLFKTLRLYEK